MDAREKFGSAFRSMFLAVTGVLTVLFRQSYPIILVPLFSVGLCIVGVACGYACLQDGRVNRKAVWWITISLVEVFGGLILLSVPYFDVTVYKAAFGCALFISGVWYLGEALAVSKYYRKNIVMLSTSIEMMAIGLLAVICSMEHVEGFTPFWIGVFYMVFGLITAISLT